MSRKVILYISASLDGFIAKPNDDLSFLDIVSKEGEDYGYQTFLDQIDTVILGRKTYDWVLAQMGSFHHADKESYVITRSAKPTAGNTHFYTGDLAELIGDLKQKPGQHIFCDGGAQLANELLKKDLIDEIILSTIPILLGQGTRLFQEGIGERPLQLIGHKAFEKGLIQSHFKLIK